MTQSFSGAGKPRPVTLGTIELHLSYASAVLEGLHVCDYVNKKVPDPHATVIEGLINVAQHHVDEATAAVGEIEKGSRP